MQTEKRFALVIGNEGYRHTTPLTSPIKDAVAMAAALERLGFAVKFAEDCDNSQLHRELREFQDRINEADVALIYFSGHAVANEGDHYLLPVDALLAVESDLERFAESVDDIRRAMQRRAKITLVFLDACRDEPFKFAPPPGPLKKRFIPARHGLMETTNRLEDAFMAFAADPGQTADDGEDGSFSPFTAALLVHVETEGLDIVTMMGKVTESVLAATQHRQRPWSNSSLRKPFYFKPPRPAAAPASPAAEKALLLVSAPQEGATEVPTDGKGQTTNEAVIERPAILKGTRYRDWIKSIASFNLAGHLESVAREAGPLTLGVFALIIAFLLMLLSQILGVALVQVGTGAAAKQVGFIFAPNWTIVYAVLFPLYLCLFAVLTDRCRILLSRCVARRIIVSANGAVQEKDILALWTMSLQRASLLLWGLLIVIVIQTSYEWITTCLMPFFGVPLPVIDWSSAAAVDPSASTARKIKTIVFSFVAYVYMAVALYIYLAILIYAAVFCVFLHRLADPTGGFRMILRDETVGRRLAGVAVVIVWCVVLGLGAGFMMRLQAIYLATTHSVFTDLAFQDVWNWLGITSTRAERIVDTLIVPSAWTGLLQMMFTLLIMFFAVFLLSNTYETAKQYCLDNVKDAAWCDRMELNLSETEIEGIRRQMFLPTVFPGHIHLAIIVAGVVLSGLFIGYGSVVLATMLYALVALVIVPAFQSARNTAADS